MLTLMFIDTYMHEHIFFHQVECNLFPDINLPTGLTYLRTVKHDESLVTDIIIKAKDVFHKNTVGPKK